MIELLLTEYDHKMIEKITGWELNELKVFYRNKVCSYAVINPYLPEYNSRISEVNSSELYRCRKENRKNGAVVYFWKSRNFNSKDCIEILLKGFEMVNESAHYLNSESTSTSMSIFHLNDKDPGTSISILDNSYLILKLPGKQVSLSIGRILDMEIIELDYKGKDKLVRIVYRDLYVIKVCRIYSNSGSLEVLDYMHQIRSKDGLSVD